MSRRLSDYQVRRNFDRLAHCPKPNDERTRAFNLQPGRLGWMAGKLGPVERRALRALAEGAYDVIDVLDQEGGRSRFLVASVTDEVLRVLESFECEGDEIEPDTDDDTEGGERELDPDFEPDEDHSITDPATLERLRKGRDRWVGEEATAVKDDGEVATIQWGSFLR